MNIEQWMEAFLNEHPGYRYLVAPCTYPHHGAGGVGRDLRWWRNVLIWRNERRKRDTKKARVGIEASHR